MTPREVLVEAYLTCAEIDDTPDYVRGAYSHIIDEGKTLRLGSWWVLNETIEEHNKETTMNNTMNLTDRFKAVVAEMIATINIPLVEQDASVLYKRIQALYEENGPDMMLEYIKECKDMCFIIIRSILSKEQDIRRKEEEKENWSETKRRFIGQVQDILDIPDEEALQHGVTGEHLLYADMLEIAAENDDEAIRLYLLNYKADCMVIIKEQRAKHIARILDKPTLIPIEEQRENKEKQALAQCISFIIEDNPLEQSAKIVEQCLNPIANAVSAILYNEHTLYERTEATMFLITELTASKMTNSCFDAITTVVLDLAMDVDRGTYDA
jgi:hypothetical protein